MTIEVDVAIIGAGIVGLAIAAELSSLGKDVFVFERNTTYGLETSSRNSEVIHAGIYYPEDSLKTKLCIEGNRKIYELCRKYRIPHKRTGKIILASDESEIQKLQSIYEQAIRNGVNDIKLISKNDIQEMEPCISGIAGIFSPSTGVVDTHALMKLFYETAKQGNVEILFNTEVQDLKNEKSKWKVSIRDWGGVTEVYSNIVINCSGLESHKIAKVAGLNRDEYEIFYCKGEYFSLGPKWRNVIKHLIYPVPESAGLGVHLTPSLDGMLRLGPNAIYTNRIDYQVDITKQEDFFYSAKKYIPTLISEDLMPDFSGIRPRLQGPDDSFRDFVISHEVESGYEGLINLIGIESPGITASPAIASYVTRMVKDIN